MNQWLPIKLAPKDGTPILAYAGGVITTVYYSVGFRCFSQPDGYWALCVPGDYPENDEWEPTHWQPLPEKPQ